MLFLILTFLSCKKDDIIDNSSNPPPNNPPPNNPPGQFNVTVTDLGWDTATINWTQAVDPDKDSVNYKIFLNDSLVVSNYKKLNFTFKNLKGLISYTTKIIAYDNKQKETSASLAFTTKKYWLKFLKKVEYGIISGYSLQETGDMTKANDEGYIITGQSEPLNQPVKFFAFKIDTLGNKVWSKYYDYYAPTSTKINLINCNGGYLICGGEHLLKIDNDGNLLWHKSGAGGAGVSINSYGQIYTVGAVSSDSSENIVEAIISKYDPNGNLLWNKRFSPSIWDAFYDIKVVADDQLIVLGMMDGNNIKTDEYYSSSGYFDHDYWVVKLTGEGDLIWSKSYPDDGQAYPATIITTKEGNFVFTGCSIGPYAIPYFYLQMIDANGNSIWRDYNHANSMRAFSVAETNDNALVVVGGYRLTNSYSSALYKFDKSGNKLWEKLYNEFATYLINKTVIPTNDGGYIINSQKSKPYNSSLETDQIYIFKTDDKGEFH